MTNAPAEDGGGVSAEDFVDGTSVKWAALATTIFGGTFLAFFEGVMGSILEFGEQLAGLWTGFGEFLAGLVETVIGVPIGALSTAWAALESAVSSGDLFAFLAGALAIVLILYTVSWGVSEIAGK